jgi:hypothetical protein
VVVAADHSSHDADHDVGHAGGGGEGHVSGGGMGMVHSRALQGCTQGWSKVVGDQALQSLLLVTPGGCVVLQQPQVHSVAVAAHQLLLMGTPHDLHHCHTPAAVAAAGHSMPATHARSATAPQGCTRPSAFPCHPVQFHVELPPPCPSPSLQSAGCTPAAQCSCFHIPAPGAQMSPSRPAACPAAAAAAARQGEVEGRPGWQGRPAVFPASFSPTQ